MIAAGFGFRAGATLASFQMILTSSDGPKPDVIATAADKADTAVIRDLASLLNLPLRAIDPADLTRQPALTDAPAQPRRYGPKSLAEAAALAAAGPQARLVTPRRISADGMVTMALAKGETP